jgi:hypothetical protein
MGGTITFPPSEVSYKQTAGQSNQAKATPAEESPTIQRLRAKLAGNLQKRAPEFSDANLEKAHDTNARKRTHNARILVPETPATSSSVVRRIRAGLEEQNKAMQELFTGHLPKATTEDTASRFASLKGKVFIPN